MEYRYESYALFLTGLGFATAQQSVSSVMAHRLDGQSTFQRFSRSCPASRRFAICLVRRVRRFFSSATRAHALPMPRLARFNPVYFMALD
jgi:hypothetical protein